MPQTINNMFIGQTQKVHVKAYAQDNATTPAPSQIVDSTSPLIAMSVNQGIASIAVDPNDNRAVVITALAAGPGQVLVDLNPSLGNGRLIMNFTVAAPPPDNRHLDFQTADAPV
mgnify:FL=1